MSITTEDFLTNYSPQAGLAKMGIQNSMQKAPVGGLAGGTYQQNRLGSTDQLQIGSQDALGVGSGTGLPGVPGGGFDWSNAMDNFSMGAQGIMGLANAYTAYKQLGLMEDQLAMQKGVANRNIANSAATTNRMLDDRASMAAQMTGGAEYGTPEHLKAKKELQTTVDGSPI